MKRLWRSTGIVGCFVIFCVLGYAALQQIVIGANKFATFLDKNPGIWLGIVIIAILALAVNKPK